MLQAFIYLVTILFELYIWAILIRIILQWQREDYYNPLSQLVVLLTKWPLKYFYKLLPYRKGFDWAALVFAFFAAVIKVAILMTLLALPLHPINLLLFGVIGLVQQTLSLYFYILLIVVITSWLASEYRHPVLSALNRMANPVLAPLRRVLPNIAGFDFSPLILLIAIKMLEVILMNLSISL